MEKSTFNMRNSINIKDQVTNDFPLETRKGLYCILCKFIETGIISCGWSSLKMELCRTARIDLVDIDSSNEPQEVKEILYKLNWIKVFIFCERIYESYIDDVYDHDINGYICGVIYSKVDTREKFTNEINTLLLEDNITFEFLNGEFYRRGRAITQKNVQRVGSILGDSRLAKVKRHYSKAISFFHQIKNPDYENTIKESICALESAFDVLTGENVSKDFSTSIKKFEGANNDQIPPPIIQSMIKIYAYRGSGDGISHGNGKGLRVTEIEAELVLNLSATYITYLYDFFNRLDVDNELAF